VAWSQLEAATPPRVAASAVHISGVGPGRIVWIGGYDDVEALARVGVLDLASGSWSEAPPLPEGRAYASAVAHEGRIFVVGGTDGRNTAALDRVYVSEHDSTGAHLRAPDGEALRSCSCAMEHPMSSSPRATSA
jgi:hypothetical protein